MLQIARMITLSLLTVLLVAACGTSPKVRYFSLSPMDTAYRQDPDGSVLLGLGPLRIPEYLNRSQIVTRGVGAELKVDEFNRWAEPLPEAMHRIVSSNVDKMLDDVVVIAFPYESFIRAGVNYRMVGELSRFDADSSGRVVLEVQWGIRQTSGGVVVHTQRSRYEATASPPDDPGAIARAMNNALEQFSRDVAEQFEAGLEN